LAPGKIGQRFVDSILAPDQPRAHILLVSAVEMAIREVKRLSPKQAKKLLAWLQQLEGTPAAKTRPRHRKRTSVRTTQRLMAWYDSIRGTTDWEIPRMPDDLVRRVSL